MGKHALLVAAAALALAGCTGTSPQPTPAQPSATPSATPELDLTSPGAARTVVEEIMAASGEKNAVKVDISQSTATISFITTDKRIKTYSWVEGKAKPVDSDVADVRQASFYPLDFDISDVGELFRVAESLGTSNSSPQLQIVEHDPGQILMSVTTRPESATVFFRADATPIRHVDFETTPGLTEGIKDATYGRPRVIALGYSPGSGVWSDEAGLPEGTISRRTRSEKLPSYTASRKESSTLAPFDPTLVDPAVIGQSRSNIRFEHGVPLDVPISVVADNRYQRDTPTITYTFGQQTVVTDLAGTDITAQVLAD
ncbi:MAG: hypothetical protein Q3997_09200 [Propionibacteriaceae bacterium]|nr:hypothetical protein [Propionibacteriaceae bacterium]